MPSPVRSVRLRVKEYNPIPEGDLAKTPIKDLIFRLNVRRLQKELTDGAEVKTYFQRGSIDLSFAMVTFNITVDGWIGNEFSSIDHSAHAIGNPVDGVEHDPDYVDLEEAALYWNNAATVNGDLNLLPQLEIEHGTQGASQLDGFVPGDFRVYKGLIQELELVKRGARAAVDFKMRFMVVHSFRTEPGIREWAS